MSDVSADAIRADFDRKIEETREFVAKRRKLMAEADKLSAEAAKFPRERFLLPIAAAGALAGIVAGVTPTVLRLLGVP